jgi:hypothetical protein
MLHGRRHARLVRVQARIADREAQSDKEKEPQDDGDNGDTDA